MADIELVIKIPEEEYKKISTSNPSYADDFSIYYAIKNGTPLPTEKLHKLYLEASVAANTDEDDAFALGELSMIKKVYEILGKEEK